ncbi:P-loop containing nucleoside triphosphate hydrolase protein [Westerdykella ornata]|uniref:P-loop containing nucleoside triphosphate hydrolase protein n=1 Tax=Westerdykella ornata TaxID=318751 RepID=A0A6A6JVF0_WESOR|nr:P-loop containing nucleoside triphosphate hydrolase protein [Westerdykella ornata]KAF2280572.1 P-loop containing nucleoside triphosphate hydrolase protein [Westerdykella ornata]
MSALESSIHRVLHILIPKLKSPSTQLHHPIVLGITGLQGSGKSTWASIIVDILQSQYQLRAITLSLDDLYKAHDGLVEQREKDPANNLFRTRGQPGTHDEQLASQFFSSLRNQDADSELRIPRFDKSKFHGEGDRLPEAEWPVVKGAVDILVFEGWCLGFQALPEDEVKRKYEASFSGTAQSQEEPESTNTLADHALSHLQDVNQNLRRYNESFMGPEHFDFLIHLDTDNLKNVYHWRAQQEEALIRSKGSGMSYEAVAAFVRGYMPAYELYLDGLRSGFFARNTGRQIRVVLDGERNVADLEVI